MHGLVFKLGAECRIEKSSHYASSGLEIKPSTIHAHVTQSEQGTKQLARALSRCALPKIPLLSGSNSVTSTSPAFIAL